MCSLPLVRVTRRLIRSALSVFTASASAVFAAQGDQHPSTNAVSPTAAFAPADVKTNTARWDANGDKKLLNVVTHFGATGNNLPSSATANTAAFRAMYDFMKAREMQHDTPNPGDNC